jgi:4-hydroxy-tetrahydrodipicolinate synthase
VTAPHGVIPALLTPVGPAGQVDHAALGQLVRRLVERGVTGLSPLGSTGEGYSLSLEQRLAVTGTVAGLVPAGMPVIPGVFAHNPGLAVAEISAYAAHGATAVLVAPPAYYPLSAAEQQGYFARVADASALPVVLYNIPVFTKVVIAPPVVAALAAHPQVSGIKDSSRDLGYGTDVLDAVAAAGADDFSLVTGTDSMLVEYMLAGAQGTICANANVVPELVLAVYEAVRAGKADEAVAHERRLRAVQAALRTGTSPAAYKAAIAALGIGEPWLVPPRLPLEEPLRAALIERLTGLEVL